VLRGPPVDGEHVVTRVDQVTADGRSDEAARTGEGDRAIHATKERRHPRSIIAERAGHQTLGLSRMLGVGA
jgi:hypothetical protein